MTFDQLHEILDNKDKKLCVKELKQVIYELRQDCFTKQNELLEAYDNWGYEREDYIHGNGFYNGEANAFQIALDLLEHLKENNNAT